MLPTNFEGLALKRPDLRDALQGIASWCDQHVDLPEIDLRRIAYDLPSDPKKLTNALSFLVEEGVLRRVYCFEHPDGYLLDQEYESYLDVPEELHDAFEQHTVHRWDGRIVPVFRGPK